MTITVLTYLDTTWGGHSLSVDTYFDNVKLNVHLISEELDVSSYIDNAQLTSAQFLAPHSMVVEIELDTPTIFQHLSAENMAVGTRLDLVTLQMPLDIEDLYVSVDLERPLCTPYETYATANIGIQAPNAIATISYKNIIGDIEADIEIGASLRSEKTISGDIAASIGPISCSMSVGLGIFESFSVSAFMTGNMPVVGDITAGITISASLSGRHGVGAISATIPISLEMTGTIPVHGVIAATIPISLSMTGHETQIMNLYEYLPRISARLSGGNYPVGDIEGTIFVDAQLYATTESFCPVTGILEAPRG